MQKLDTVELSEPLSTEESARFFQLITFVDRKINKQAYPKKFGAIFTESIREAARKAYMQVDVWLYPEFQRHVGKLMLDGWILFV